MGDDEAKRIILMRRARFVAAALAGLNAAMCGGQTDSPSACLSVAADDGGTPQPCLTPSVQPPDASTSDADAAPQPCLSPIPQDAGGDGGDGG
jgi:hypothetical protein